MKLTYSYKGKVVPVLIRHHPVKTYGEVEITIHAFLTLALGGD
jgi:hypothetical protein